MNKKAMEVNPPSLVVVIILVLVVLLVLIYVFGTRSGTFLEFVKDIWCGITGDYKSCDPSITDENTVKCENFLNRHCGDCGEMYDQKPAIPPPGKKFDCPDSDCNECIPKI